MAASALARKGRGQEGGGHEGVGRTEDRGAEGDRHETTEGGGSDPLEAARERGLGASPEPQAEVPGERQGARVSSLRQLAQEAKRRGSVEVLVEHSKTGARNGSGPGFRPAAPRGPSKRAGQRVSLRHASGIVVERAPVVLGKQVEAKTIRMRPAQRIAHEDHVAGGLGHLVAAELHGCRRGPRTGRTADSTPPRSGPAPPRDAERRDPRRRRECRSAAPDGAGTSPSTRDAIPVGPGRSGSQTSARPARAARERNPVDGACAHRRAGCHPGRRGSCASALERVVRALRSGESCARRSRDRLREAGRRAAPGGGARPARASPGSRAWRAA